MCLVVGGVQLCLGLSNYYNSCCQVELAGDAEKSRTVHRYDTRYIPITLAHCLFPSFRATIVEFQETSIRVYECFLEDNNGDLASAKIFMSGGLAATAGNEGFYSIDGVKVALMIRLHPENPTGVVDNMFLLMEVGL